MPIIKVDQVQTTASKKILGTTGSVINVVQNQITTPWYGHSPGSSYILVLPQPAQLNRRTLPIKF